jgi:hypothetical protein
MFWDVVGALSVGRILPTFCQQIFTAFTGRRRPRTLFRR